VITNGVCQIASGGNTVFAVTTNGTLITWGDNTYGQQKPPSTLSKVIQFVLGLYHGAALRK
jgi:alpha-tubulin suppressor-like RCC1 family protein